MSIYRTRNESKSSFIWLMAILLVSTNFLGLEPFADLVNSNTKPIILFKCLILLPFAIKISRRKNDYTKWLLFLWIAFALNKISSCYFRGQSLAEVPFHGAFIYDFALFYLIAYINPSIKQMEKAITYLGMAALTIYFVQYLLLPKPIVESLTSGWRAVNDAGEFDVQRFSVTGEVVIFLYGFYALNNYFIQKKKKYIIVILAVLAFTILHGYRSLIIAFLVASAFLYFKINGLRFNKTTFSIAALAILSIFLINYTSIFDNVLSTINEKNEMQSSSSFADLDRIVEWDYFYNSIGKPWEWLFGAGFIGKNFDDAELFFNWVDIGFLGISFMGGALMTICWIRLLLLNTRACSLRYQYVNAFSVFLLVGTITLSIAFSNKSIVFQCLVFYLMYKIELDKYRNITLKNIINKRSIDENERGMD